MGHVSGETTRAVRLFRKPLCCLPEASYWDVGVMSTTGKALFLSGGRFEPFTNSFCNTAPPPVEGLAQSREAAYSTVKTAGSGASVVLGLFRLLLKALKVALVLKLLWAG